MILYFLSSLANAVSNNPRIFPLSFSSLVLKVGLCKYQNDPRLQSWVRQMRLALCKGCVLTFFILPSVLYLGERLRAPGEIKLRPQQVNANPLSWCGNKGIPPCLLNQYAGTSTGKEDERPALSGRCAHYSLLEQICRNLTGKGRVILLGNLDKGKGS